jgi:hypothetical protein
MKLEPWQLPKAIYRDDCVGMTRADYDALAARLAEAERLLGEVYREEFEDRGMTPRVCAIALWFSNRHAGSASGGAE